MLRKILAARGLHTTSGRFWWSYPGWWFEDHKSRPWPRNEEQRKAAATRYGLRDGDYTPVKEDYYGGIGDYPDLGDINYDVKDPYENYSYEKFRRNFTEPVPFDFNIRGPDKTNFTKIEKEQGWGIVWRYFAWYGGLVAFLIFLFRISDSKDYPDETETIPVRLQLRLPVFRSETISVDEL